MRPEPPPENICLFLDVDGTLIDIAPTPDSVVVPDRLIDDLVRAEERLGGALALVSGRTIADLDRLFAPLTLKASGVHGSEFRFGDDPSRLWVKAAPLSADGWLALSALSRPSRVSSPRTSSTPSPCISVRPRSLPLLCVSRSNDFWPSGPTSVCRSSTDTSSTT